MLCLQERLLVCFHPPFGRMQRNSERRRNRGRPAGVFLASAPRVPDYFGRLSQMIWMFTSESPAVLLEGSDATVSVASSRTVMFRGPGILQTPLVSGFHAVFAGPALISCLVLIPALLRYQYQE